MRGRELVRSSGIPRMTRGKGERPLSCRLPTSTPQERGLNPVYPEGGQTSQSISIGEGNTPALSLTRCSHGPDPEGARIEPSLWRLGASQEQSLGPPPPSLRPGEHPALPTAMSWLPLTRDKPLVVCPLRRPPRGRTAPPRLLWG